MSAEGKEPDWVAEHKGPEGKPAGAAAAPAGGAAPAGKKPGIKDWSTSKVVTVMRLANAANGLGMIGAAVLQVMTGVVSLDFQVLLLSFYVGLFGLLLTCAECHFKFIDKIIASRFGFLYSYIGRSCFIMFAATINFALNTWIGYLVGALTLVNGIFNFWVIKLHPGFRAAGLGAYSNPYDSYTGGEAEMKAYLSSHPELAQKALKAGVSVAQQNPALATRVITTAAASGALAGGASTPRSENPFDAPHNAV